MTPNDLKEYLKKHMTLDVNYDSRSVRVKLLIDNEVIAKGSDSKYPKSGGPL